MCGGRRNEGSSGMSGVERVYWVRDGYGFSTFDLGISFVVDYY